MAWTTQGTYHGRPSGSVNRASIAFPSIKSADAIVEGAETVTGNYRTTSGTPGGGLQSPRTVPTVPTSCGSRPGVVKGLTYSSMDARLCAQQECFDQSLYVLPSLPTC